MTKIQVTKKSRVRVSKSILSSKNRPPLICLLSPIKGKEGKEEYLYSAFLHQGKTKRSGMNHTVLPANNTMPAFPSWRSPDVTTTATEAADIQLQLTTHLSTPKGWKAELAYTSAATRQKRADFTAPTTLLLSHSPEVASSSTDRNVHRNLTVTLAVNFDLWPMSMTEVGWRRLNHRDEYLSQASFRTNAHTYTHRRRLHYTTANNNYNLTMTITFNWLTDW